MNQFTDAVLRWIFSIEGMKAILPTLAVIFVVIIARIVIDKITNKLNALADEHLTKNEICPKCGSKLIERNGKYGSFIGCSNYPKCRYTHDSFSPKDNK